VVFAKQISIEHEQVGIATYQHLAPPAEHFLVTLDFALKSAYSVEGVGRLLGHRQAVSDPQIGVHEHFDSDSQWPQWPVPRHLVGVLGYLGRGRAIAGISTSPLAQIELSVVQTPNHGSDVPNSTMSFGAW
jgi:hypothetical protein